MKIQNKSRDLNKQCKMKKLYFFLLFHFFLTNTTEAQINPDYFNPKLEVDQRVDDLIMRMTIREKVSQLFNNSPAIERLGVPAYNWWNECLHGVARAGHATVFPQAIGLAATFDQNLMFRVADAISDEARAKHNYFVKNNIRSIYTGLTFWTPNINIFRDPRWGRGQETYGEDPYLTARMGVNFINGLQGNDPKYLKTVATAKHYAVHSGPEFTRHTDNIFVNNRDLYDTYLPAFMAVVKESKVQSIMCAYNRFRDKPCCGNDVLLNNILRNKFGFDGYVVSDCGAISDFYEKKAHDLVESPEQAWGWAISSGTDLNCEESKNFIRAHLDSAVQKGIINESDINISLKRLFKARFMLGMFDSQDQVPFTNIPISVVGSPEHLKLAQEAAEKSMVLLKNSGILPLKNIKKIALIGPNADNTAMLLANYHGIPIHPVTPLKALQEKLGASNVFYSVGCPMAQGIYTNQTIIGSESLFHIEKGKLKKGLKGEYFNDPNLSGVPKLTKIDDKIDFHWTASPLNGQLDDEFSVRWTGLIIPQKTANYILGGNVKIKIDGKEVKTKVQILEKGKRYSLEAFVNVESTFTKGTIEPSATMTWTDASQDLKKEALKAASKGDVIIFCGGISANLEGEEMSINIDGFSHGDRTNINLPKVQEDLLIKLYQTGKPIIYVNFSGSAIALNWEDQNLPAIVQAFYPGEATGIALTRLLFGDFNPSGRLPITVYHSVNDLPDFHNYEMLGRTYRYFKGQPLYPFGYGLSYTTFEYYNLKMDETAKTGSQVTITAEVKNSGNVDGEEVIQLYVSNKTTKIDVPITALKGFQRIFLKKGEQKTISFTLTPEDFSFLDPDNNRCVEEGLFEIAIGGGLPDKNSVIKTIRLEGNKILVN